MNRPLRKLLSLIAMAAVLLTKFDVIAPSPEISAADSFCPKSNPGLALAGNLASLRYAGPASTEIFKLAGWPSVACLPELKGDVERLC